MSLEYRPTSLDKYELMAMFIKGWTALCTESGAFLSRSNGRMQSGRGRRYVLILPNKTIEARGGLFKPADWNVEERKFLAAHSDEDAIADANKKLIKMLEKRAKP